MIQQQQKPTPRPKFTLGKSVLILLDLVLGFVGIFFLYLFLVLGPVQASFPARILQVGIVLGGVSSFLAGICFLARMRHIAAHLQLVGALGGLLLLIGLVGTSLASHTFPRWDTVLFFGAIALGLMVLGFVGKRLAESEE